MLCYRYMLGSHAQRVTPYLKFYDAEAIPLLLRQYSNRLGPAANSCGDKREEHEFLLRMPVRNLFLSSVRLQGQGVKSSSVGGSPTNQDIKTRGEIEIPAETPTQLEDEPKLGLVARFKRMYKEYWYVLVPVHLATSACWLGGFFYLSKSGVDIASIMESWRFNETIIAHLRDSKLGHVAIAYFLYKIFTPLRYMVTLGGTTVSIKYLSRLGYIKPVPSKNQLIQMYQDKKAAKAAEKAEKALK